MKKVLLIEDNEGVRETTADILMLADYEVQTAENGKIGVEKALEFHPDVIICDVMMPELDGYGVLHILGKKPEMASIPFIFLTAKSEKQDMRKGMNLGADDYLTKPFEETELLDAVESRLKKNNLLRQEFQNNVQGIDSFFAEASQYKELQDLSKDRTLKKYEKKQNIFMEDGLAYLLYFIQSGKVKTYKSTESGKEFVTGMYGAGDFIGQVSLLNDSGTYNESAMVLEDAELCAIPKADFTKLIFGHKEISNKFINMLSNNLREREQPLVEMAYASVRQRTAKALLDADAKAKTETDYTESITLSRENLAGMIGTAKETAIRTLSDFKEDGLIAIELSKIRLLDKEKLGRLATSSYL